MIPTTYPLICGLDVHRGAISAALLDARGQTEPILYTKEFSALTYGLYDLRQWLLDHDCHLVAMESSGIYWKAPYNVLTEANISSHILNPYHVKAIPGKKSDQTDRQADCLLVYAQPRPTKLYSSACDYEFAFAHTSALGCHQFSTSH